jgi:hypothetical protein
MNTDWKKLFRKSPKKIHTIEEFGVSVGINQSPIMTPMSGYLTNDISPEATLFVNGIPVEFNERFPVTIGDQIWVTMPDEENHISKTIRIE